jgi:Tfp pilus assembly protein PilE
MVGRKLIVVNKLQASTILEVVIAMVIIMVVFGIAMMIFSNVMLESLSVKKIHAEAMLNETMLQDEHTGGLTNQTFTIGNFRVDQEIKGYNDDKNLLEIDLTVYDANQQKITELKKIIISK